MSQPDRTQIEPPALLGLKQRLVVFRQFIAERYKMTPLVKLRAQYCLEYGVSLRRAKEYFELLYDADVYRVWRDPESTSWLLPPPIYSTLHQFHVEYTEDSKTEEETVPRRQSYGYDKEWSDACSVIRKKHYARYTDRVTQFLEEWKASEKRPESDN